MCSEYDIKTKNPASHEGISIHVNKYISVDLVKTVGHANLHEFTNSQSLSCTL